MRFVCLRITLETDVHGDASHRGASLSRTTWPGAARLVLRVRGKLMFGMCSAIVTLLAIRSHWNCRPISRQRPLLREPACAGAPSTEAARRHTRRSRSDDRTFASSYKALRWEADPRGIDARRRSSSMASSPCTNVPCNSAWASSSIANMRGQLLSRTIIHPVGLILFAPPRGQPNTPRVLGANTANSPDCNSFFDGPPSAYVMIGWSAYRRALRLGRNGVLHAYRTPATGWSNALHSCARP